MLVGAIDNGEKHSVVWGDAYVDGDGGGIFTEEAILAGDPTLIFEAKENAELLPLADEDAEPNYGEIVTYLDITDPSESEIRLTAIYTPGIVDQENEELSDAAWVNSYGGYVSWDALEAGSPLVYVKGAKL